MHLWENKINNSQQQKWLVKLMAFDFNIVYNQGEENKGADALFRKIEELEENHSADMKLCPILLVAPNSVEAGKEKTTTNANLKQLV